MAKRGSANDSPGPPEEGHVRLDQWLWAARFHKTRALASQAIAGGKVSLNGDRPKRSRAVRVGDQIRIQAGPIEHLVTVLALANRRGPASAAAALYVEDPASVARRAEVAARLKAEAPLFARHEGRPTKRDRRAIGKLRRKL